MCVFVKAKQRSRPPWGGKQGLVGAAAVAAVGEHVSTLAKQTCAVRGRCAHRGTCSCCASDQVALPSEYEGRPLTRLPRASLSHACRTGQVIGPPPVHAVEEQVEVGSSAPLAVAGLHQFRRRQLVLRHAARAASDRCRRQEMCAMKEQSRCSEPGGAGGGARARPPRARAHRARRSSTAIDMRLDSYCAEAV